MLGLRSTWTALAGSLWIPPVAEAEPEKAEPFSAVATKSLPVLGNVACGEPIFASEERKHFVRGSASIGADFCLTAKGDSMINAAILSGDLVVVRPQRHADDGQIVVARIGDEATVKRLSRRNGQVWLMPENENYEPIDGREAEIIGLVKAVVREY